MLKFLYVIALLVVIAGLAVIIAVRKARIRALLRRQVHEGDTTIVDGARVTVRGVVRRLGELVGPLSGKPCVLHETHATYAPLVDGARETHDPLVAAVLEPFELDTEHGVIRVEGSTFQLVDFQPVPIIPRKLAREREFLEAQGRSGNEAAQTSFAEVRVEPGARIAVHGLAVVDGEVTRIVADDAPLTIEML